jgi:hypothetical protein
MTEYRERPSTDVDPATVALAELVASQAARDLGIKRPRVAWFRQGYYPGAKFAFSWGSVMRFRERLAGTLSAGGGTIWLSDDLGQAEAMETSAHEVRHAYQKNHPRLFEGVDTELDADRYARQFMSSFATRGR